MQLFAFLQILFVLFLFSPCHSAENTIPPRQQQGPTTFSDEWRALREKKGVRDWMISLISQSQNLNSGTHFNTLPLLHLCEDKGLDTRFDRKSGQARQLVEKAVADDIEKMLKGQPKESMVQILSIGSIGFLQEFFLVSRLVQQGRTHIEITHLQSINDKETLQGMNELVAALADEGIFLSLKEASSSDQISRTTRFHAGYCILSREMFLGLDLINDIVKARTFLAEGGRFIFSQPEGTVAFSNNSGVEVIEMTQKARTECNAITATQFYSQRSKDRTIRVAVATSNPRFYFGSLLFAMSELLKNGYSDIFISAMYPKGSTDPFCKSISSFFDLLNLKNSSPITFQWKTKTYVGTKQEFRKDLVLIWLDNVDIKDKIDELTNMIVLTGSSLPEHGHWIFCSKDLGLWDIDANRNVTALEVPKNKEVAVTALVKELFSQGLPWYK